MIAAFALTAILAQQWIELDSSATGGGVSSTPSDSQLSSLAVDSSGRPAIAWSQRTSSTEGEIRLKRWSGTAWVGLAGSADLGGVSMQPGWSVSPSVKIDSLGRPVVAWSNNSTGKTEIYVKRWDGAAWVPYGSSADPGGVSLTTGAIPHVSLGLDPSDRPVVCWRDNSTGVVQIYLKRWNGEAWVPVGDSASLGGISNTTSTKSRHAMALDGDGNPVVLWNERSTTAAGYNIKLRRWNGSAWAELANSATGSGIAYTENPLICSVAVDSADRPSVAWIHFLPGLPNPQIYLKRWDGAAWVELGGSASGSGISGPAGNGINPSVAIDSSGAPVVTWQGGAGSDIYLVRWDGSAWSGLAGSAGETGLSGGPGASSYASVTTDQFGSPAVVWQETTPDIEIYFKKMTPPPTPPQAPTALLQRARGLVVAPNGLVAGSSVSLSADSIDPNDDPLRFEVEVRLLSDPLTGTPTSVGTSAPGGIEVTATGLLDDRSYHWQLRSVDSTGLASPWVHYGTNSPTEADFRTAPRSAPTVSTLSQATGAGLSLAPGRAVVNPTDTTIVLRAVVNDVDAGDVVRLEVELQPAGTPFSNVATAVSEEGNPGDTLELRFALPDGGYHWQARGRDDSGKTGAWIAFGSGAADFSLTPYGSAGGGCAQAPGGRVALPGILVLLGLAAISRYQR